MPLYLRLMAAGLRAQMQYKWDFLVTTLLYALLTAVDFLLIATILYRYRAVAGWNVYEIALLAGVTSTSLGLFRVFGSEVSRFEQYLVTGEFDQILTRPLPTLGSLLSRNLDLGRLGAVLQGALVMALGLEGVMARGAPGWLPFYVLLLPLAGAGIVGAVGLVVAAAGFWLTRIDELQTFAINAPLTAAQLPLDIFPGWLKRVLTGILPVAAIGYYPLHYALGKGGTPLGLLLPFLAAGGALFVALAFWRLGERNYQSTGS